MQPSHSVRMLLIAAISASLTPASFSSAGQVAAEVAACCIREWVCLDSTGQPVRDGGGAPVFCPTRNECAPGSTCEEVCAELTEADCDDINGYWLGSTNLPPGEPAVADCSSGRCEIGSCCLGPGQCDDRAIPDIPCDPSEPSTCENWDRCGSIFLEFVGGALCHYPEPPCPFCEFEAADNCQAGYPSAGFRQYVPSDGSLLGVHYYLSEQKVAFVAADDFVARGSSLGEVCVQGLYINAQELTPYQDCADYAEDDYEFMVTVYADAPGHRPGAVVATRPAVVRYRSLEADNVIPGTFGWIDLWRIQLLLVEDAYFGPPSPIPLEPGSCYWIEVSNNPVARRCDWYWVTRTSAASERNGNEYSMARYGAFDWQPMRADLAFCLDIPFDEGGCGPVVGTCCSCADGGSCAVTTFTECDNAGPDVTWDSTETDCAQVTCSTAAPINDACQAITGDTCPGGGICVGGPFAGGPCSRAWDCGDDAGCFCQPSGPVLITTLEDQPLTIEYSTNCATSDIPQACSPGACQANDVWFQYRAGCPGRLIIDTCGTVSAPHGGFDSVLAVYHDDNNPASCACPQDNSTLWPQGKISDEGCTWTSAGGGGLLSHPAGEGGCFLIRVGGYATTNDGDRGTGVLTVRTEFCFRCDVPPPPEGELIDADPGPGQNLVAARMNRYLSFRISEPGQWWRAVQVTFKTLPPPWDVWNGRTFWVDAPQEYCETSGIVDAAQCPAGTPRFDVAGLICGFYLSEYSRVWTTNRTVYVRHPGIVPGGTYELRTFSEPDCNPNDASSYSAPLTLTLPRWGDIGGPYDPTAVAWTAPNGSVGITTDVTALLGKFANRPGAPGKARADLEPLVTDLRINITDVTRCLDAFRGLPFPFTPDGVDPCAAQE